MEVGMITEIEGNIVKIHVMGEGMERDLYFTYTVGGMGDVLFSLNGEYYGMADMHKQGELIAYDSEDKECKQLVCWMLLRSVSAMEDDPATPTTAKAESRIYDVIQRDTPNDLGLRAVRLWIKSERLAQYFYKLGKLTG